MFGLQTKKERRIDDATKKDRHPLEVTVEIQLTSTQGYSVRKVASVKVEKTLHADSDSPIRLVTREVTEIAEAATAEAAALIQDSSYLSDGFIAAQESSEENV